MERNYWLRRYRVHVASAADAATSEIRLIHLDLAGRYSVKAAAERGLANGAQGEAIVAAGKGEAETRVDALGRELPALMAGWRPSRTHDPDEADVHLAFATRVARLHDSAAGVPAA